FQRNGRPFGELAEAVPWAEAAQTVTERGPVGLAGLLLGTAGLLLEATLPEAHAWRALQRQRGLRQVLQSNAWDRRQVRLGAQPARRCRGLAELASRYTSCKREGLAEQILALVRTAAEARRPVLWRFARTPP